MPRDENSTAKWTGLFAKRLSCIYGQLCKYATSLAGTIESLFSEAVAQDLPMEEIRGVDWFRNGGRGEHVYGSEAFNSSLPVYFGTIVLN
jgi:hypothetical protein